MNTKFEYEPIDFNKYFDAYMKREDAIRCIPPRTELEALAKKAIVKEQLILTDVPADEPAQTGDTLTIAAESELPRFNKEKVKVTIGRGLYDRTLEQALTGLKVGERCSVVVKDKTVTATILGIQRKLAPEPTDAMVAALEQKDFEDRLLTTVTDYIEFVCEEKRTEALASINYYVVESILSDYPIAQYDAEDIRILGELERDAMRRAIFDREGVDIYSCSKEKMQELFHVDSMDAFIDARHDWYQMKIQQCLIFLNILALPCEGKYDPLDHYEVLSELQDKMFDKIEKMLAERSN